MARRSHRLARAVVLRTSDARLERLLGSRAGLRMVFGGMERAYVPGALDGFTGELGWALRRGEATLHWSLRIARGRAVAAPGPAEAPAVLLSVGLADLARIAVGELDPMRALLAGQLDVEGDFAVASRLGELFGRPPGGGAPG